MNFAYGFDSNRYRPIVWLCQYGFFPISFKKTDFTKEMHSRQTPGRHIAHISLRFWIQIKNCNLIRWDFFVGSFGIYIEYSKFEFQPIDLYEFDMCVNCAFRRIWIEWWLQFNSKKGKKIDYKRFSIISLSNFFFSLSKIGCLILLKKIIGPENLVLKSIKKWKSNKNTINLW